MPDTLIEMLRQFGEVEKPKLQQICSPPTSKYNVDKMIGYAFMAFMVITTSAYMVWNLVEVNRLHDKVQNVLDDRADTQSKAKKVVDEVLKIRDSN